MRRHLGRALTSTALGLSLLVLSAIAGWAGPSTESEYVDTLRFLQVESETRDYVFALDVSGSITPALGDVRAFLNSIVDLRNKDKRNDFVRDGDRLVVMLVGAEPRIVLDEHVTEASRPRIVNALKALDLVGAGKQRTSLGVAMKDFTDLPAARALAFKNLDAANGNRLARGNSPVRQFVTVFSDDIVDVPKKSPYAFAGMPESARTASWLGAAKGAAIPSKLRGLLEREPLYSWREFDRDALAAKFGSSFQGVPMRVITGEYSIPPTVATAPKGTALHRFSVSLAGLVDSTRPKARDVQPELPLAVQAYQAKLGERVTLIGSTELQSLGRDAVQMDVSVKSKFGETVLDRLSLEVVDTEGGVVDVTITPNQVNSLKPGESAQFTLTMRGVGGPAWYQTRSQRIQGAVSLRPVGIRSVPGTNVRDTSPQPLSPKPVKIPFDTEIPAGKGLYAMLVLLALLVLTMLLLSWFAAVGPKTFPIFLLVPGDGDKPRRFELRNNQRLVFGGKDVGQVKLPGIEQPQFILRRQLRQIFVERVDGAVMHIVVNSRPLVRGNPVHLSARKGSISVSPDTSSLDKIELRYSLEDEASKKPQKDFKAGKKGPPGPKPNGSSTPKLKKGF